MVYGYGRVSSIGQMNNGNSLEDQRRQLEEKGCEEIYLEAYTGMTTERPELSKILEKIKKGDTLVVTKLDRFSRTAAEGCALIQELQSKGVIVEILNMGRADNTPMGKLMVTMLLAFAEFEHDMILERLSAGREIARQQGKRVCGRKEKRPAELWLYYDRVRRGELTVNAACDILGISRRTWYNRIAEANIKA